MLLICIKKERNTRRNFVEFSCEIWLHKQWCLLIIKRSACTSNVYMYNGRWPLLHCVRCLFVERRPTSENKTSPHAQPASTMHVHVWQNYSTTPLFTPSLFSTDFYVSNNNVSTSLVSLLTRVILTSLPRWLTHLPRWFAWLSMFVLLFNRKASVAGSAES